MRAGVHTKGSEIVAGRWQAKTSYLPPVSTHLAPALLLSPSALCRCGAMGNRRWILESGYFSRWSILSAAVVVNIFSVYRYGVYLAFAAGLHLIDVHIRVLPLFRLCMSMYKSVLEHSLFACCLSFDVCGAEDTEWSRHGEKKRSTRSTSQDSAQVGLGYAEQQPRNNPAKLLFTMALE